MLDSTVEHLIHSVLPAAADYEAAERSLTEAFCADQTPAAWEAAARHAKRRAAELAIAIDGLTDRSAGELGWSKSRVRQDVAARCKFPGVPAHANRSHDRVRAVAQAYKHAKVDDPKLPLTSQDDVLAVAMPYGAGLFGVGKSGGPEVIVVDETGERWKFLGDAPMAIGGWFSFLADNGGRVPTGPIELFNVVVHP